MSEYVVRRLTPLECERLQGYPDHWTDIGDWIDSKGKKHKGDSDSPRYKALGNSIAISTEGISSWDMTIHGISDELGRKGTMASLFDGIGGFPLVWNRYNGDDATLWASEIEEFPIAVTKIHFPQMKHLGDITKINGADVPPVDCVIGGSPCQDLSVAGKRAGLDGERSGLFMEQIRLIKEMRANATDDNVGRFAIWENVPGAFSSNKGEDFRCVLEEFCKIKDPAVSVPMPVSGKWAKSGCILGDGYSVAWRVCDARYWSVPQRRARIHLICDFGGQSAPEILFECKSLSRYSEQGRETGKGVTADTENRIGNADEQVTNFGFDPGATRDVGVAFYKETSKTLANGSCPGHHQGVVSAADKFDWLG